MKIMTIRCALVLALLAPPAFAQQSPNYKVENGTINDGGHPEQSAVLAGATYRVSLDAIGNLTSSPSLGSASFHLANGFVQLYTPPGEVLNQRFTSNANMTWDPEQSVGVYEVYRGTIGSLPGGYGTCYMASLAGTFASDAGSPPLNQGWFYLVTAKNGLGEEGTKGYDSANVMRANPSPCP
jgi:hypothetical protein